MGTRMPRISAILVSRFLLHLQATYLRALGARSEQTSTASCVDSIVFERVIGSLAAPIAPINILGSQEGVDEGDSLETAGDEGPFPERMARE